MEKLILIIIALYVREGFFAIVPGPPQQNTPASPPPPPHVDPPNASVSASGASGKSSQVTIEEPKVVPLFMYIEKSCPDVKNVTGFANQEIFTTCASWTEGDLDIVKATSENAEKALCTLFVNNFTSFCSSVKTTANVSLAQLAERVWPDTVEVDTVEGAKICTNLSKNSDLFNNNAYDCIQLCVNKSKKFSLQCVLANYYANFNVSSLVPPPKQSISGNSAEGPGQIKNVVDSAPVNVQSTLENTNKTNVSNAAANKQQESEVVKEQRPEGRQQAKGAVEQSPQVEPAVKISKEKAPTKLVETPVQDSVILEETPDTQVQQNPKKETPPAVENPQKQPLDNKPLEAEPPEENAAILPIDEDNNNQEEEESYPDVDSPRKEEKVIISKPSQVEEDLPISNTEDIDGESYFFSYFMVVCVLFVLGYVFYHNRTKVMALVIEGKRNKRQYRGRRPNSANYHKLDSNLEEAISSSCNKSKSNVIY